MGAMTDRDALPFAGIQVIESPYCVTDGDPYSVVRSWRERLLTRPWRPWERTRMVTPKVPTSYMVSGTLFAHPAIVAELRRLK